MRKVPLEGWRDLPEPILPNLCLTASARLLQAGLSQHVQQFVLASEGSLWQVLIPALGSSPSGERRGPHSEPRDTEHPRAAALCNPHTKRWSLLMGLPA